MRLPRLQSRGQDDAVVLAVEPGYDIDITNAGELEVLLLEAVPSSVRGVVLDLRSVGYIDSAGVRLLFGLARKLATSRQRLGLWLSPESPVLRLVEITQLERVVPVCTEEAACLAAVRADD